jgi:adenosylhomocysteine nucleosidase
MTRGQRTRPALAVHDGVADDATMAAAHESPGIASPPPARPRAAAVVFAVNIEADAFARLATDTMEIHAAGLVLHEGTVAGRRVAWCVGGIGSAAAARAARLLIAGHHPRLLVTAGFAGGLDPALPRGAVVRPTRAIAAANPAAGIPLEAPPNTAAVTICTADRIIRTPAEKRELAARTAATLVDMESFAVATVAREAGLPCAGMRVVSDAADDELPPVVAGLARPQSTLRRLGAALGAVGRRPRAALELWHTWEHAVTDGRTLAAALAALCAELPAAQ